MTYYFEVITNGRILSPKYHLLNILDYICITVFYGNELRQVVGAKMRPMYYVPLALYHIDCQSELLSSSPCVCLSDKESVS